MMLKLLHWIFHVSFNYYRLFSILESSSLKMNILDCINPTYFFLSFFVGILFVYIFSPIPEIIMRYPTPENAGKQVYRDRSDTCYVYDSKEVSCPASGAVETAIQHPSSEDINNNTRWNKFTSKIPLLNK